MRTRDLSDPKDLTNGNLFRKLILFALPILLTQILNMLFTTADLFTVSKFGEGALSVGAIGVNNSIINLIVCLFLGLSVGANIVVANAKGKDDKNTAYKATQSSVLIAILSGVVIAIAGWFLARPMLKLINTGDDIIDKAETYLRVYLLGAPFALLFNFGSSILRAYGDSKRPLYALLISGIFNLGLNILFVGVFKLDVLGVAIATDIAQACGSIAVLCFLAFDKSMYVNFDLKNIKIYPKESREILKLGVSAGLQSLIFNITNLIIQSGVNSFGSPTVSGNTIASNIEGYQYFVLNSIAVAVMAMVSQNNGAKKKENVLKTLKYGMILQLIAVSFVGIIIFLIREPLVSLFIDPNEANKDEILKAACDRIVIISLTYFICGFMETFSGYYRGLKYSLLPTIVTVIGTAVFRIIFLFTLFKLDYFHTMMWLFGLYPITWVLTTGVYCILFKKYSNKAFGKYLLTEDISDSDTQKGRYGSIRGDDQ